MGNRRHNRRSSGLRAVTLTGTALATLALLVFAGSGTAASQAIPSNTAPPTFSGDEQDGKTLTAANGTWSDSPTSYEYQWQRCNSDGSGCSNISGATSQTYTLGSADVGNKVRVGVRATNADGTSGWSYSGTSGVIASAATAPANTSPPTISGTAQDNQTLTAANGTWTGSSPITYAYDWQRCDSGGSNCSSIGQTGQTYVVTSNDVGHRIRVKVTATNSAGSSSATSSATDVATAAGSAPANTSAPTISGTAQDNQTLTANAGKWSGTTPITYTFDWRRCDTNGNNCVSIASATTTNTTSTYKVTSKDVGHRLRVVVTATNSTGSSTATSAATGVAIAAGTAPKNTAKPVISGKAQVGQTLTTSVGKWTGVAPISYLYQWYRCDSAGNNCIAIGSAIKSAYKLLATDVGRRIRVVVAAKNQLGSAQVTSDPTATVVAAGTTSTPSTPKPPTTFSTGAIPIASVSLPNRLVIGNVKFTPKSIRSRSEPVVGRFRVVDSNGRPVAGALVYAIGVPANRVSGPPEATTDATGWATLVYKPLKGLPFKKGALLTIFIRARKPGGKVLGGVSTRRLVSIRINPA